MSLTQAATTGAPSAELLTQSALATALWLAGTAAVALPLGLLAGTWLDEFAPEGRARALLGSGVATLARLPSVAAAGAVAAAALWLGWRPDGLGAGCVVGAIALMPLSAQATRRSLHAISPSVREACAALGASRDATLATVVLPTARPLVLAELARATARVAGDAAPLIVLTALAPGASGGSHGLVADTLGPTALRAVMAGQFSAAVGAGSLLLSLVLLLRGLASIIHGRAADRLVNLVDPR
jgi:phosphate transport system permease protein